MSETIRVPAETNEADALNYLDFARELVLADAGPQDGTEPTDEIKAGLADLVTRAKAMLNEGNDKPDEVRSGATIGGRIQTVIDGERVMLEWHMCLNVRDEAEIAAAEIKRAIRGALREALKEMTGGPKSADVEASIRAMLDAD